MLGDELLVVFLTRTVESRSASWPHPISEGAARLPVPELEPLRLQAHSGVVDIDGQVSYAQPAGVDASAVGEKGLLLALRLQMDVHFVGWDQRRLPRDSTIWIGKLWWEWWFEECASADTAENNND